jgi:hypothetical protein
MHSCNPTAIPVLPFSNIEKFVALSEVFQFWAYFANKLVGTMIFIKPEQVMTTHIITLRDLEILKQRELLLPP